jgi:hypothetical protein
MEKENTETKEQKWTINNKLNTNLCAIKYNEDFQNVSIYYQGTEMNYYSE